MATTTGLASPAASYASDTELAVFIPEIWADAVRAAFKKQLVLGNLGTDFSCPSDILSPFMIFLLKF